VRRKHHKVRTFPPEIVSAVHDLLASGVTYDQITAWLRERGFPIHRASVARYGKDFAARLERIRAVEDQAKAILEETAGEPLQMEEATTRMALHLIAEHLLRMQDLGEASRPVEVIRALAHLQASSASRERLRLEWQRRAQAAAEHIETRLSEAGSPPDLIREIRTTVLGLAP